MKDHPLLLKTRLVERNVQSDVSSTPIIVTGGVQSRTHTSTKDFVPFTTPKPVANRRRRKKAMIRTQVARGEAYVRHNGTNKSHNG